MDDLYTTSVIQDLIRYALTLTKNRTLAEDIVQDMFTKRLIPRGNKDGKELSLRNYNLSFLKTATKYQYLDYLRKKNAHDRKVEKKINEIKSHDFVNSNEYLSHLVYYIEKLPLEQKNFYIDYMNSSYHSPSDRKKFSRIKRNVQSNIYFQMIAKKEYQRLNAIRIDNMTCKDIASIMTCKNYPLEFIYDAFNLTNHSRLLQSLSGILYHISILKPTLNKNIQTFMKSTFQQGLLYRGNLNYLSDRLLDYQTSEAYSILNEYVYYLNDYSSSITNEQVFIDNSKNIDSTCIYDIKKVSRINEDNAKKETKEKLISYFENNNNIDLHRTATFQLLRYQYDKKLIQYVVNSLSNDIDQTNAYYISKFLRHHYKQNPHIINDDTLNHVTLANQKWPMNRYIRDTKNFIKRKLNE